MSDDLISRQAILDMLEDINNHIIDGYGYRHDWCVEWVNGLPSIDAVQVIRCKDCKQCRKTILFGHLATVCDYWIKLTNEDGYCNHAERKEE